MKLIPGALTAVFLLAGVATIQPAQAHCWWNGGYWQCWHPHAFWWHHHHHWHHHHWHH
jgi:hypothetical protein